MPQHKGDLTPYWEDGAGSSALETRMSRNAADRLTQAETLSALLAPAGYQPAKFTEAWRNVLLYSEHTWGAWCSVSDSENPFTTKQWNVKREFAVQAEKQSQALLNDTLLRYANSTDNSAIDIHNSTSWPRTEVVILSKSMPTGGDGVKDSRGKGVPSQRMSTGELALLVEELPAFGSARFHITSAKAALPAHPVSVPVSVKDGVLDNGILRARIDQQTGNIIELMLQGKTENLIDASAGEQGNEYLFLEGKDTTKLQKAGTAKITVEENGPLVATLRIESSAPGCNSMVRRVSLSAGADFCSDKQHARQKSAHR